MKRIYFLIMFLAFAFTVIPVDDAEAQYQFPIVTADTIANADTITFLYPNITR